MDKLIKKTNLALVVGTNSWREQFIEAITVSAGECLSMNIMNDNVIHYKLTFPAISTWFMSKHQRFSVMKLKEK